MPNRLIHEKALRSHTLARLSAEAERLFWRLTAIADDQGRFDAYPSTVKAGCFPTMVDSVKTKDVVAWLVELSQECCKLYTVDGRQYGYFVKWAEYQRIYGNKPKFPQPPADCGELPQSPALILTPTPITTSTSISIGPPVGGSRNSKGKRPISDEDKPTEKHFAYGQRLGLDVGPEWGKFVNYCKAHDQRYADFEAAFRNWLANANTFKGGPRAMR
jgi:hypothetical protein